MSANELVDLVARLRAAGCVFADDEARLLNEAATAPADLDAMVERRVAGEPLEYILGFAEFCGLRISVAPGVFVPRQRTEFLVRVAAALGERGAVVLDMCCGSGGLGAAAAALLGSVELHATDIDPIALECARRNVPDAYLYVGDLFDPLPATLRGRVDLMLANVPYVPSAEIGLMPPEARLYERIATLDGGSDGLDVLRRLAPRAASWLAPSGYLLVETSDEQAPVAAKIMADGGLKPRISSSEEFYATIVVGRN